MKATEINGITLGMAHCDWITEVAKEIKALFSHRSETMIAANKTRALACIGAMMDSINELRAYIEEVEG